MTVARSFYSRCTAASGSEANTSARDIELLYPGEDKNAKLQAHGGPHVDGSRLAGADLAEMPHIPHFAPRFRWIGVLASPGCNFSTSPAKRGTMQGNLLANLPDGTSKEQTAELLASPYVRIERIVSTGQASPPGFWYDQDQDEWVLLVAGAATEQLANEPTPRRLHLGDYLLIPAHSRHRVEWTDPAEPTIWLANRYRA